MFTPWRALSFVCSTGSRRRVDRRPLGRATSFGLVAPEAGCPPSRAEVPAQVHLDDRVPLLGAAAACGADHVVRTDPGIAHFDELARIAGVRVVGRKAHVMLMGGFPYVVEAVGAPQSVTEALRAVAHRGTLLLLGAARVSEVDLTPVWYKEAALVGAIDHTFDAGSTPGLAGGPDRHSIDRALDILRGGTSPTRHGCDA